MSYIPNQEIAKEFSETSATGINSDTSVSGGNWSVNTYTGAWELNEYAYLGVNLQVDEPGTLYFDFSQDNGASSSSYPVAGFTIASGINEVHTAWKGLRHFRVRFVGDDGTRTYFRLKTFFSNHPLPLSAPVSQSIGSDQDATVVRAVGIGEDPVGSYVNQKTDGSAYSTTSLLADGATYDSGILDAQGYTQVQTHVTASHDGTIQFLFHEDSAGTDTVRTLTLPYIAANGYQLYSAPTFSKYIQYKFTNNGGTTQTDFYYETKFYTKSVSGQLLRLDAPMAGGMIANVGRNVVVGQDAGGAYRNAEITKDAKALNVSLRSPLAGFGELQVAQVVPQTQLMFPYGVNPLLVSTRNNGGSTTTANGKITCSTGAAANQTGGFVSRNVGKYNPGQGHIARFTGAFTTGAANSTQYVGIGDAHEGFFFGYNGTSFGVLHRYGGAPEIRTLTVTTASTTAENITVTLDGDADATVAVTNTGNVTLTANEIANHDYSDLGDGWTAVVVGDTVVFTSYSTGSKAGTYSISGTTAVGTFAQTLAGASPTEDFTAQTSWNIDPGDNTDILPTMDWTKGNVFQIQFQYLGYGAITYFIEAPDSGTFIPVHRISYANANADPSLSNASLPLSALASNAANTSDISLSLASMMSGSEGVDRLPGIRRSYGASRASITTTELPILTLRSTEVFNGVRNRIPVKMMEINASNDHGQSSRVSILLNATLTGASFADVESNISCIEYDSSASAFTGGRLLYQIDLGPNSSTSINLRADQLAGDIEISDAITFTGVAASGSGAEISVAVNWVEEQ